MLDAALDAVAAADVDVVVHAHRCGRDLQRQANLVGKARHLDRGINVEQFAPRVPVRHHAEGLDRHRRGAAPFHPQLELARAGGEILRDFAPDEGLVEQHVRAVLLVHQRAAFLERLLGVEHEGQGLVVDLDRFGGVFGERASVGDDRRHPFAGIARGLEGERPPRHVRGVEARHQRRGRRGELGAVEHVMHAGHFQRRGLVDALDARRRVGAGDQRHVLGVGQIDIGDEIALAGDEAAVLAHAAVGRDIAVVRLAHRVSFGRLAPRMRSAASAIASTICA